MNLLRILALSISVIGLFMVTGEISFGQPMITIQGGSPSLTISTGTPAGGPNPVINTNARLRYRRSLFRTKITVSTVCPGQSFNLSVVATGATIGIAAPPVNLFTGMPATDFITDILPGFPNQGRATLRYTASATFQQGNSIDFGNDAYVVTYTIIAQ